MNQFAEPDTAEPLAVREASIRNSLSVLSFIAQTSKVEGEPGRMIREHVARLEALLFDTGPLAGKLVAVLVVVALVSGCGRSRNGKVEAVEDTKPKTAREERRERERREAEDDFAARRRLMLSAEERGTAIDLRGAFERNGVAAARRYKGKSVCVVGVVDRIDTDVLGRGFLVLTGGPTPLDGVNLYFDRAEDPKLAALDRGEMVVAVGKCAGDVLGFVVLESCRLVEHGADPKEVNARVVALRDGKR